MRRLTKIEKKAAVAVIGMTAAVVGAGVKLLHRHTKYMIEKAAAFFSEEDAEDLELAREAEAAAEAEALENAEAAAGESEKEQENDA